MNKTAITQKEYEEIARMLNCETAAVKSVAAVESGRLGGFDSRGNPVTLFEGHIFWKELKNLNIDPIKEINKHKKDPKSNKDLSSVLYPRWTRKFYGRNQYVEKRRLKLAISINEEAALKSASYGRFQIMGFNYKLAGFNNVFSFVDAMNKSEFEHLKAFANFVIHRRLDDELREHRWADFAYGYNGKSYHVNKYDEKIARAYKQFKEEENNANYVQLEEDAREEPKLEITTNYVQLEEDAREEPKLEITTNTTEKKIHTTIGSKIKVDKKIEKRNFISALIKLFLSLFK